MSADDSPTPIIDPEFASALRPLKPNEESLLRAHLVEAGGCTDPLVVWAGHNILLDGHHRLRLCQELGLEYSVTEVTLPDRASALVRILGCQHGRRNANAFAHYEALVKAGVVEKIREGSKKRQGLRADLLPDLAGGPVSGGSREVLRRILGVGTGQVGNIQYIHEHGPEDLLKKVRSDELRIGPAYRQVKREKIEKDINKIREDQSDPHVPDAPVTQRGDLWYLGDHKLLCGDSQKPRDVRRVMGVSRPPFTRDSDGQLVFPEGRKMRLNTASCLWTDPPYGVGYTGGTEERLTIQGDSPEDLPRLIRRVLKAIDDALEPGSPFYMCHPAGERAPVFFRAVQKIGWHIHQGLVWVKDTATVSRSDYQHRHEPVLYGWKPGPGKHRLSGSSEGPRRWFGDDTRTSVFEVDRPKRSRGHPTQKPLKLIGAHLRNSTQEGDVVLDPFAGSGSTVLACEELRRECRAIEVEPQYVDCAVGRWIERYGCIDIGLSRGTGRNRVTYMFNDPAEMARDDEPVSPLDQLSSEAGPAS